MAPTTRTSRVTPPRWHPRRPSSAVSATSASRTRPTTPPQFRRPSSKERHAVPGEGPPFPLFCESKPRTTMKYQLITAILLVAAAAAPAQVASHAPTAAGAPPATAMQVTGKPVAKVNGVVLTDKDLWREMYAIFPYARQHNGFPKSQEAEIRKGALDMLIFEELVYQDAERRKVTVSPAKPDRATSALREQFQSPAEYEQFLQAEFKGSPQLLRKKIRRSLLIEELLKTEVQDKSAVSPAELKAFYDKN